MAGLIVLIGVVAACGSPQGALSGGNGTQAAATAMPSGSGQLRTTDGCSDPIKCSTPPPGYTPYVGPPCDALLTTAHEIRAAAAQMHAAPGETPAPNAAYGDPLLVHAMSPSDADEWLVPVSDGAGGASSVVAVGIRPNGRGCAGMASGWSGPFPRISIEAARRRAAGPNDPVATIEAVHFPWTRNLPPATDTQMVWRVVRQSGHEVFLFGSGDIFEGSLVRANFRATPLRGERPGATPWPEPSFPPNYSVATPDEVRAGARSDPFVVAHLRYLRGESGEPHDLVSGPWLDRPAHVVGLHKPYTIDLWILPVRDQAGVIVSVISVGDREGMGQAMEARAWSGPFPRVSEADAKQRGSLAGDPATSAQLGWAEEYYVSPGGPTSLSWLVTRGSGAQLIVTEDGAVVPAPPKF